MSWIKRIIYIISFILFLGLIASIGIIAWKFPYYIAIISVLSVLIIFYGMNIILGIYIYYNKKRINITKKSWLFTLLLLPGFGIIIFLWTGFNPFFKRNLIDLGKNFELVKKIKNSDYSKPINDKAWKQLFDYCNNQCLNTTSSGNVELIKNDYEIYQKVIEYIKSAKKYIFINFYILSDGFFLKSLINELYKKHCEGIKVYIMYDWVGCRKKNNKDFFKKLADNGLKIYTFKKKSFYIVSSLDNSRNHKKSLIIDGYKGIIGGFNIADEYINQGNKYRNWKDHGYLIKGSIVKDYLKLFLLDWINFTQDKNKQEIINDITHLCNETKTNVKDNQSLIQTYNSFPEDKYSYAYNFYLMAFTKPVKRIWIYSPYFYPTEALEYILISLAKAGVDVRLMLPGQGDNKPFYVDINRYQYLRWLNHNIKVYEYNGFSHVKTTIIDDDYALVGTVNIDPRALNINYEAVSIINDKKLNNELEEDFIKMMNNSNEITLDNFYLLWKEKSLFNKIYTRLIVWFLLIFEPLL